MISISDKFEDGILFTYWEFPINVTIEDEEVRVYLEDYDITHLLTDKEIDQLVETYAEHAQAQYEDDIADRADWEYEQMRDRKLMDKAGSVE